ncbi:MAG: TrkH family potassium uptake protein [Candidatus Delongbacteria bacterium]|nr:TrkH family potassium uptake protein [Candidatus Delongbacteria bacterium]
MIFPLLFSFYYGSDDKTSLLLSILATFTAGAVFTGAFHSDIPLRPREGFVIVSLGWIFAAMFGALPFFFYGIEGGSYVDCVFETMSGFTTTGSSILTDIEILPKGILIWRSLTHWLGGMGIIVLAVAILPVLGLSSAQLFKAEVSGPTKDKISPKIKDTAKILWYIYFGMTFVLTALLMFGGMDFFNALCHTFGTLGTGGFSTLNRSVAGFESTYIEVVIMIFMYLSGINFFLHFSLIKGKFSDFLKNREWRFYTLLIILTGIVITLMNYRQSLHIGNPASADADLLMYKDDIGMCIRHSFFQTISLATATGFATANFDVWSDFAKLLLIVLMFIGGCAGSTSGGIKQIRVMIVLKFIGNEIKKLIYPRGYFSVRIGDKTYDNNVLKNVIAFFILYLLAFTAVTLLLTSQGYDIVTSFSASVATISGVGPGLARVGAIENFAFFNDFSKIILIFNMLLGRLELYSVLILIYSLFNPKRLH